MTFLDAALDHAAHGYLVLPCVPWGEAPLERSGVRDASADEATIRARWALEPRANVGLVVGARGGLFALDVQVSRNGHRSLDGLARAHGELPVTREAMSPDGTWRFFFAWPAGARATSWRHAIAPGIVVHSSGHVLVAPSVGSSGRAHRWTVSAALAEAPTWLIERVGLASCPAVPSCPASPDRRRPLLSPPSRGQQDSEPPDVVKEGA